MYFRFIEDYDQWQSDPVTIEQVETVTQKILLEKEETAGYQGGAKQGGTCGGLLGIVPVKPILFTVIKSKRKKYILVLLTLKIFFFFEIFKLLCERQNFRERMRDKRSSVYWFTPQIAANWWSWAYPKLRS